MNRNKLAKYRISPPILEGFEHVKEKDDNKFTIRNKSDGSEFTWIPVSSLKRINFQNDLFSNEGFHEEETEEFLEQMKSVQKYGGFYISRFNISKSIEGKPISVEGLPPWTQVTWYEAKSIAETYGDGKNVKSHLPYGSEIDSMLFWLKSLKVNSECKNEKTSINLEDADISVNILNNDDNQLFRINDIFNMNGNIDSWTQEEYNSNCKVVRGSGFFNFGKNFSQEFRLFENPNLKFFDTGFRIALCIK